MIRGTSLLLCLIIFAGALSARAAEQFGFDTWTTDDGLPQNGVRSIAQTPDGYLWFTTFDGLVRFDGLRFTTFNKSNTVGILNNRFSYLFADLDGTLYATTSEDGTLTIYRNGEFKSYTSDEVPGHYIQSIKRDSTGELKFLSEDNSRKSKTWYYLRSGQFVAADVMPPVNDAVEVVSEDGSRWVISRTVTRHFTEDNVEEYDLDLSALSFQVNTFIDRDGALWIGETRIHRLFRGKVKTFGESEGIVPNSINHSFWQDESGIWFATGGGFSGGRGIGRFTDGKFVFFGKNAGLPEESIFNVYHDREGGIWLATNKGISRLRKRAIQTIGANEGLNYTEVYPMMRDRSGTVWIGTSKGLSVFRDGRFESIVMRNANPSAPANEKWVDGSVSVQSLFEDTNGKLWIGLNGGIFLAQNGSGAFMPGTVGAHVFAIRSDRTGDIWVATNKGLWRFRNYVRISTYGTADGLPNEFMTEIFEDSKGTLWFGGLGGLTEMRDGRFSNYTARDGLAGNYVRTIHEDADGVLWIGTYDEGLSRYKDGKFSSFKESKGLFDNGVFAIREDARGNFWISSNNGIYRVSKSNLNDYADGRANMIHSTGYGIDDGMIATECNGGRQPASLTDEQGRFWFPTQNGIAIVDPNAESNTPVLPEVVIESATVEREPAPFRGGLKIAPGQRNIELTFTGVSLLRSRQTRFRYMLEGHDRDWVEAGTRRSAHYSYLPPGVYKFRVIAANSDGAWNNEGAVLEVTLEPFFYQTLTFYILCGIGGLILLAGIWKLSVLELRRRERKLTRLVAERTEELRQANAELEFMANSDTLTKIGNRRRFESFLSNEWNRAFRSKTEISLVLLDIDHFKLYNDTYGHQTGDECLQRVAEALADAINRPTDLVARFGGEEFAIVLGSTDSVGARRIAAMAIENVNQMFIPHLSSSTSEFLTISAGIGTIVPEFDKSESDLIRAADAALYQAKKDGRNRVLVNDLTLVPDAPGILDEELLEVR